MNSRRLAPICSAILTTLVIGCANGPGKQDADSLQQPLQDVVDAVQAAVTEAAKDAAWNATKGERGHFDSACEAAQSKRSGECWALVRMHSSACSAFCKTADCTPQADLCKRFLEPIDRSAICAGEKPADLTKWCLAAANCAASTKSAARLCSAADSIQVPELKEAVLTVAVEKTVSAKGEVNLIIVSIGGDASRVASNTVELVMKPRLGPMEYGDLKPSVSRPKLKEPSETAKSMGAELAEAIKAAARASINEEPADGGASRPPLALSGMEILFSLTIDRNGKVGIKKEWATPAGIELGGGRGAKRTNTLKVVYGRPD